MREAKLDLAREWNATFLSSECYVNASRRRFTWIHWAIEPAQLLDDKNSSRIFYCARFTQILCTTKEKKFSREVCARVGIARLSCLIRSWAWSLHLPLMASTWCSLKHKKCCEKRQMENFFIDFPTQISWHRNSMGYVCVCLFATSWRETTTTSIDD